MKRPAKARQSKLTTIRGREAWHLFAEQLEPDARLPHYDLVPSKRALAVRHGAIEATRRQLVERLRATIHVPRSGEE